MKVLSVLLSFLFVSYLDAEIKWIPIEPIELKKSSEPNIRISDKQIREFQPVKKIVENAKVIHQLLDNKHNEEKKKSDTKKNWYIIKNMENN
ncbi:hypothetical protein SMGD1_0183 [Sulfurimonas gotlandica GD1]|uniref:Uncharacterized protein n=1 Tax=Sulfurimonas gotlandica (strain DSM 19862 / JCM 16533 / GD1) TaxID=929558 RepID=B6BLQ1_SULGG|nr:hypothetical protein [Sulfurimonas gotlandica]EDZ62057.1 hypothetical protein CBGD1_2637 [Sulfurimonas gotlandica GD1]EHP28710.1 hypothetical protein SMGD1_0183 [Sulfurimonas gotlandica GD1]